MLISNMIRTNLLANPNPLANPLTNTLLVVAVLLIGAIPSASAQEAIGVVNIEQAVAGTAHFQTRLTELQAESDFVKLSEDWSRVIEDRQAIQEEIRRDGEIMTTEQRRTLQVRLQENQADLEALDRKLRTRQQSLFQRVGAELQQHIETAMRDLVSSRRLAIVLNQQQVLYAKPEIFLTQELVKAVDRLVETEGIPEPGQTPQQ